MRILSTSLLVLPSLALSVVTTTNAQDAPAPAPAAPAVTVAPRAMATVKGKVIDESTKQPLENVGIYFKGDDKPVATTEKDGTYEFKTAKTGSHELVFKRLSYKQKTVTVNLSDGKTETLDVTLSATSLRLNEVTTTAGGTARKVEVGYTVGEVKADSVVKDNVVNNIGDLLNGRIAGLDIQTTGGLLGQAPKIRIRGINSYMLDNNPIVVVDGIRYQSKSTYSGGGNYSNPLGDLSPDDIESIEVVKGPSAASLYGTDASNGVIVIKTKQGKAGQNRWAGNWHREFTGINLHQFPAHYVGYGHTATGKVVLCDLQTQAAGKCTQDSIVAYNALSNAKTSVYRPQPSDIYGTSFSGGNTSFRYFMSGNLNNAVGPLEMPKFEQTRIMKERGLTQLPDEYVHPNAQLAEDGTVNLTSNFTQNLDLNLQNHLTLNYVRGADGGLGNFSSYNGYEASAPSGGSGGYSAINRPGESFSQLSEMFVNRFTTSLTTNYRMFDSKGQMKILSGVDYDNTHGKQTVKRGEGTDFWSGRKGYINEGRAETKNITAEGHYTFEFHPREWLSSKTSTGYQYTRNVYWSLYSYGYDIPKGRTDLGSATTRYTYDSYSETIKSGKYIEQDFGINDRIFASYALRSDGAATFGDRYISRLFPKTSFSWNIIKEPWFPPFKYLDGLRLRAATGESGIQPPLGYAQPYYYMYTAWIDGSKQPLAYRSNPGNAKLGPERQAEREGGADIELFDSRLYIETTNYRRTNSGLLSYYSSGAGIPSIPVNAGMARLKGGELVINTTPIRTNSVEFTLNLNASHNQSKLVSTGGVNWYGYVAGYGLRDNLTYYHTISYNDVNHNGVIDPSEVANTWGYPNDIVALGYGPNPASEYTINTGLTLFGGLRMTTSITRKMKYTGYDNYQAEGCWATTFRNCRAAVDPSTSLWDQAKMYGTYDLYSIRMDNTWWRDASLNFDVPRMFTRMMRVKTARVAFSAQNLRRWAKSPIVDNYGYGNWSSSYDYSWNNTGVPLGRTYQFRVDLDK